MIRLINKPSLILLFLEVIFAVGCSHQVKKVNYYKIPEYRMSKEISVFITPDSVNFEFLECAIFSETNLQRQRLGLIPFKYDPPIQKAARLHSQEMVELDYFDHTAPTPINATTQKRLKHVGIRHGFSGENIAVHPMNKKLEVVFNDIAQLADSSRYAWRNKGVPYTYREFAFELVERWMKSPEHRINILSRYFKFLGVGCAQAEYFQNDVSYITQDFSSTNY